MTGRRDPMGDEAASDALDFLNGYAKRAGLAKANATYMEEYRKVLLARLKREAPADIKGQDAREDWARTQPEFLTHLQGQKDAVTEQETLFWKRIAAEATIEAWRTKNANLRGAGRMQ